MKKLLALLLSLSLLCTFAAAFASAEDAEEIEVFTNVTMDEYQNAITELADKFTEETGIKVTLNIMGEGYEELMKTRMASNDMPDVFCTHGWAVARYGEYTRSMNDRPWAADVKGAIGAVTTNNDGELLVLPSTFSTFGINYNADVLAEAGVEVTDIKTWSDFEDACEKIKALGKAPIAMGGKDSWLAAQPFQVMCPTFLTEEQTAQLADGSFNWDDLAPVIERYISWAEKGFFNVDALTADFNTAAEYLGAGEACFYFCDTSPIVQALTYYPDANLHLFPIPAWEADYSEAVAASGEYLSWAVWKDSKHEEAALKFVDFLASVENTQTFAATTSCVAGLNGADIDYGDLSADYEVLGGVKGVPVWDRTLPSGMFNDMCTVGQGILAGDGDSVSDLVEIFRESYLDKMA